MCETFKHNKEGKEKKNLKGNGSHFIWRCNEELISLNVSVDENKVAACCCATGPASKGTNEEENDNTHSGVHGRRGEAINNLLKEMHS